MNTISSFPNGMTFKLLNNDKINEDNVRFISDTCVINLVSFKDSDSYYKYDSEGNVSPPSRPGVLSDTSDG